MDHQCYFCHTQSFHRLLDYFDLKSEQRKELTHRFFEYLGSIDDERTAPEVARDVHARFKDILHREDLYAEEKRKSNMKMLDMYPRLKQEVLNSDDPFNTALRLSIGGNIIDVGPAISFDIEHTIRKVLSSTLAIDHSENLREAMKNASRILYLGDNTGEIVVDRLFLETLNHPNVTFAVRGDHILNDATIEDAHITGMSQVAKIISNGDDAPSTLLHRTSKAFNDIFEQSDLIISKGMGNFEGLVHVRKSHLFFMLVVKCDHIGNMLGVKNGDFIIKQQTT